MTKNIIRGCDGTHLIFSQNYNAASKVGIVLLHGLAEHKGRYDDFILKLFELNISVFAIDLRGHGESHGK